MDKPNQFITHPDDHTQDPVVLILENDETLLHEVWTKNDTQRCIYTYLTNEHIQALLDGKALFTSDPEGYPIQPRISLVITGSLDSGDYRTLRNARDLLLEKVAELEARVKDTEKS